MSLSDSHGDSITLPINFNFAFPKSRGKRLRETFFCLTSPGQTETLRTVFRATYLNVYSCFLNNTAARRQFVVTWVCTLHYSSFVEDSFALDDRGHCLSSGGRPNPILWGTPRAGHPVSASSVLYRANRRYLVGVRWIDSIGGPGPRRFNLYCDCCLTRRHRRIYPGSAAAILGGMCLI